MPAAEELEAASIDRSDQRPPIEERDNKHRTARFDEQVSLGKMTEPDWKVLEKDEICRVPSNSGSEGCES